MPSSSRNFFASDSRQNAMKETRSAGMMVVLVHCGVRTKNVNNAHLLALHSAVDGGRERRPH